MRLRHFSPLTEEAYLGWIRRYHEFHGRRDPAALGADHVTAFLNDLATRARVAAATQNQALAALLFLYREVLGIALPWLDDLVRARTPAKLPVVLTRDEVRAVRHGKGDKDCATMLPAAIKPELAAHLERVLDQHLRDLATGAGWVELPGAVGNKLPFAGRGWPWQWVFPATRH